jgi:hypothetical protein
MGRLDDWLKLIDRKEVELELAELRTQKAEVEAKIALAERIIAIKKTGRWQWLADLTTSIAEAAASHQVTFTHAPTAPPVLPTAIVNVFREHGEPLSTEALAVELERRGWLAGRSRPSINSALSRLVKAGDLVRVRYGVYALAQPSLPADGARAPEEAGEAAANGDDQAGSVGELREVQMGEAESWTMLVEAMRARRFEWDGGRPWDPEGAFVPSGYAADEPTPLVCTIEQAIEMLTPWSPPTDEVRAGTS